MVLLTLVVLNLPSQAAVRLKLAISSLFLPLFGLAGASQQILVKGPDYLLPRREVIRELEQLRRENQELRLLAAHGTEAVRENNRLRGLIGWQQQAPWKLKPARVVLRDPANWWRSVQIDLGSRDGLRADIPVLTPDGLVGRVASVGLTRSQVLLLGDPKCLVSAVVENQQRDQGILGSGSPLDNDVVELNYLARSADVKPGQSVRTSGLGGVFPQGIPIGKIVDTRPVEYGLYTQARVKLAAHLSGLDEVWVLLP